MISGGGTGGHIYPALALIERLKEREMLDDVLYVGTKNGLENQIVPQKGIQMATVEIQGFKRKLNFDGLKTNLKTVQLFLKSVREANKIIREFKPDIVIGTGGYVSGAVVYAASHLHIPTIIHEQNSVAGMTNKFLARFVDKVAISFEAVSDQFPMHKVILTGNPRAQQVANILPNERLAEFGLSNEQPTALVFGGSRGAPSINQAVVQAIPALNQRPYQVLFVTGNIHFERIQKELADQTINQNIKIVPYINDMPTILPDVKVIVGRAGATSLAEITALGIPSLLIPSPYVTNDHQTKNAQSLVNRKAALMLSESQLNGESLVASLDELLASSKVQVEMASAAKKAGIPDAADRLIEVMQQII